MNGEFVDKSGAVIAIPLVDGLAVNGLKEKKPRVPLRKLTHEMYSTTLTFTIDSHQATGQEHWSTAYLRSSSTHEVQGKRFRSWFLM